ncbi:MAG: NADH-quinone oxidoreductase subunit NuoG [Ilumatobacteraceae bacterium]|jgi:NADH-quinone oxidoreductase subunit G|nr:NADH-quinone oxidoreductase subunit NuoG [Ilumatobacteraceae bacterium]
MSDETIDDTDGTDVDAATEPEPEPKRTLTVTVDGRPFEAQPGSMVIDAAIAAGSYVPHFCYHPRMTPVGMCRQCFVEVDGPRGPMMVVSCMTPVAEGQVVRTDTPQVKRAQEGVLELLLVNHPLDCPVCDKGGECPLQDQAFSHGPGESRFVEQKRHWEKPIPISDLVFLDRERCIQCDRCTRFADEVAGDKLIHFISRGNDTQVMTFPDEPFSSYFSGNTVQICPVGALTASPYRFKARPWDLDQRASTCTTCSVGCRTVVQSTRDELVRYQGLDVESVNWGWLCDRGRFNFESIGSDDRLTTPLVRGESGLEPTSWTGALGAAARLVTEALESGGPRSIGILGGARGTNEDAFAWAALADALGVTLRDAQVGDGLPTEVLGLPRATITDAANAPTIVLLGPDLKEELPVLYLRLRDAAEKRRSRIVELSSVGTGLSRYAWKRFPYEPGLGAQAVSAALADPEVRDQLARGPVVVVAGRGNLAESQEVATATLASLLDGLTGAGASWSVLPALRRGNVVGALQLGMAPSEGAGGGLDVLRAAAEGRLELLVLVGSDPMADCPDTDLARRALAGARRIVAVDTFLTASSEQADVVLAAAAYGEKDGTTTNLEGRVSGVVAKVTATGTSRPDWMIATELGLALGHDLGFGSVDDVTDAIATRVPAYAGVTRTAVARNVEGVLTEAPLAFLPPASSSAGERNNYDYRLVVSRTLYDRAVGTATSPSLAHLAPGPAALVHPLDLELVGVSAGTEVQLVGARSSVVLPLHTDATVPRGTVRVRFQQGGGSVGELVDASTPIVDVRIERL